MADLVRLPVKFVQGMQLIYELQTLMVPIVNFTHKHTPALEDYPKGWFPAGYEALARIPWRGPGCTGIVAKNSADNTVNHAVCPTARVPAVRSLHLPLHVLASPRSRRTVAAQPRLCPCHPRGAGVRGFLHQGRQGTLPSADGCRLQSGVNHLPPSLLLSVWVLGSLSLLSSSRTMGSLWSATRGTPPTARRATTR